MHVEDPLDRWLEFLAGEFWERNQPAGNLPFRRIFDPEHLEISGLDPAWFGGSQDNHWGT